MANIYQHKSENIFKTWLLMGGFFVFFIMLGFLLSRYFGNQNILYIAVLFSIVTNLWSYWFADKMVLRMAGAKQIESKEDYPELWNIVENLSITAGLPMPKLYIVDDPAPNAFATGRNPKHAVVAVTTGILPLLTRAELEGVIAHELSHVGNRDMLVSTIVVVLAGTISIIADMALRVTAFGGRDSENKNPLVLVGTIVALLLAPLAATLIRLAVSRQREFLADASGALLTRYPEGLASALRKIENFPQQIKNPNTAMAHLYIYNPFGEDRQHENTSKKISWLTKMFMTHPPTDERIKALMGDK